MTAIERIYDAKVAAIHRLRVNVKSLAAEARIIRREERRCGSQYVWTLQDHRRRNVREESRYAGLALAFVRGQEYQSVESKVIHPVDSARLSKKLRGFYSTTDAKICEWLGTR